MSGLQGASHGYLPSGFPQFPRLPGELRTAIWDMAMDEPRTVHFLAVPDGHVQRTLVINNVNFIDVPVFFFVNWECREIAIEQYTKTKAQFKARAADPDSCFLSLELNFLVKDGDKLEFHNLLPCYTVFPLETGQHVNVQWEHPLGTYDIQRVNHWLQSLPSGCNKGNAVTFPDEMTYTLNVQQQKPPYFAFDMPVSEEPVWFCVLVENREEILEKFEKWQKINLWPHLLQWLRSPHTNQPLV